MADNQARSARDDVYDHEHEEPRPARRRRQVADWGVGDDVFDHMPRNRFSRTAEGPPRERRVTSRDGAERRAAQPNGDGAERHAAQPNGDGADRHAAQPNGDGAARRAAQPSSKAAGREAVGTAAAEDSRAEDGRRTIKIGRPEDVPSEIAAITADRDLGDVEAPTPAEAAPRERPERRTVKIGGRPEGSLEAARFHREHARRRPPRTAHERIGARPDRLAMWAVALGLLLILIAILTAL